MATLGGVHESEASQNSVEIDSLARFAVEEHNKKENAMLEFARVVKAKEQVVAGTMHHLTIEAIEAGKKNIYEAKVWVKPWLNFIELKEFKHAGDVPVFTSSDLGVLKDGHGPGWQSVPVHDPSVQDAANHALKSIQQSSNSLFPYNLQEIVHANAEVEDDSAKFDLLLKVKRGSAEEKLKEDKEKRGSSPICWSKKGARVERKMLALVDNRTPLGVMSSEDLLGEVRTRAKLNSTVRTQQSRLPCVKPATPARAPGWPASRAGHELSAGEPHPLGSQASATWMAPRHITCMGLVQSSLPSWDLKYKAVKG
ncbi:hypothetical protein OIU77_022420 [Salix suchowensis]|uniref:Cysteine proteinase inhibitor n=1 Tax=Salix suchowensis TaxID=1278906 RepID=A0ABQ9C3K0_9ROSI|nr:hypothetical protein OIU77_022420 [Salix suchowensis]